MILTPEICSKEGRGWGKAGYEAYYKEIMEGGGAYLKKKTMEWPGGGSKRRLCNFVLSFRVRN